MLRDLRFAVRTLAKQPVFTGLAILTFGLGIGADTAIFTVADATLNRALPFPDANALVTVSETRRSLDGQDIDVSFADFLDWEEQSKSFSAMAAMSEDGMVVRRGEGSELQVVADVTPGFFQVLGVPAARGRTFEPSDGKPAAPHVAVVTHGYWQSQLGGDPDVVGHTVTMDDEPFTIVGVLPRGYAYGPLDNLGIYLPLRPEGQRRERRNLHWTSVIARLAPGVPCASAAAEMNGIAARLEAAYPSTNAGTGAHVRPLDELVLGKVRPIVVVLLCAVALVLIIACANVANLALARATARRRELAIRAALGASRARLVSQLATESVVTALCGGALGVFLAMWGVDVLVGVIPQRQLAQMPWLMGLGIDVTALGFAFVLALLVGVIVGIVPGLAASRHDVQSVLGEEGRTTPGRRRARLSDILVAAEVAMAFMLLVGAALCGRSLLEMTSVDPGLDTHNALTVRLVLSGEHKEDAAITAAHDELLRRIGALPGVAGAGSVNVLPLTGTNNTIRFVVVGRPEVGRDADKEANIREASDNYFQVARVPLRAGRLFQKTDGPESEKVVIINEALAAQIFPNEDPVGKSIVFTFKAGLPPRRIVGVVGDQRTTLDTQTPPAIFEPVAQSPSSFTTLFIRTSADPVAVASAVRHEIAAFDPTSAILDVMTMDERIAASQYVFVHRFPTLLVGAFAILALVLAVVGLYGVLTYAVGQRTHEIGVRRAVGADGVHIARLVLGRALLVVGAGMVAGAGLALALTGFMRSMLYGIGAHDPLTFVGTGVLLLVVTLAACGPPIRRALRVDPMEALRS